MQQRYAEAFQKMVGLMAVTFVGGFLAGLAAAAPHDPDNSSPYLPPVTQPSSNSNGNSDSGAAFVMVISRSNQNLSWFVGAAAWKG